MIELSNSKKTFLGNTPQGKNRFALDCSIGAVQFKDNLGAWQDIAPRLVRSGDKYISEGVPYRMEFDSKGGRREYPDRYDLSKYIDLPAMPLVSEVSPKFRADKIVYSTNDYDITMGLGKTGTFLEVLFRKAPTLNKLALDASSVGMDIGQLLLSKSGLGIPRPRLIDSSEMPIERMLDWSFKSGQLEVGFDFSGLKFPVLFKNSPLDVQVGASLDDAWEREYDGASFTYGKMFTTAVDVYNTSSAEEYGKDWGGYRFVSAGFPPQGTTIDVAYFSGYPDNLSFDDANFNIHFEELAAPAAFTTDVYNITSRDRTEASVSWVADSLGRFAWKNSPSLCGVGSPAQELFDAYSPTAIVVITRPNTDATKYLFFRAWDDTTDPANTWGAILHLEWEEAGGGTICTPGVIALSTTKFAPVNQWGIIPNTTALTSTKYTPVMGYGYVPSTATLTSAKYSPVLDFGIIPSVLTMMTTKFAPILGFEIIPSTTSLTTTKYIPVLGIGIIPSTLSLSTTKYAPVLKLNIITGMLSLTLSEYSPILKLQLTPSTLALILTEYAPTINLGANIIVTPGLYEMLLSFFIPSMITKDDVSKSGRYGTPPTTTWGSDVPKTGRYGSQS